MCLSGLYTECSTQCLTNLVLVLAAQVLPDANERCPEPGLLTHCTYFRGLLTNGEVSTE